VLPILTDGNGTMAQFNHWELGGGGQWMQGGMTMVGDMFNNSLKAKVDGLCFELSNLLAQQPFKPSCQQVGENYEDFKTAQFCFNPAIAIRQQCTCGRISSINRRSFHAAFTRISQVV
jgi:hypothetical protein